MLSVFWSSAVLTAFLMMHVTYIFSSAEECFRGKKERREFLLKMITYSDKKKRMFRRTFKMAEE